MPGTKWLRPKDGVLVRYEDPRRGHIPPGGDELPLTVYYRRRENDGDLVPGNPPAAAAEDGPAPDGSPPAKTRGKEK